MQCCRTKASFTTGISLYRVFLIHEAPVSWGARPFKCPDCGNECRNDSKKKHEKACKAKKKVKVETSIAEGDATSAHDSLPPSGVEPTAADIHHRAHNLRRNLMQYAVATKKVSGRIFISASVLGFVHRYESTPDNTSVFPADDDDSLGFILDDGNKATVTFSPPYTETLLDKVGFVYVLSGAVASEVKVGWSIDVLSRLKSAQTFNPHIRVDGIFWSLDAKAAEKIAHANLAKHHVRIVFSNLWDSGKPSEWFRCSPDVAVVEARNACALSSRLHYNIFATSQPAQTGLDSNAHLTPCATEGFDAASLAAATHSQAVAHSVAVGAEHPDVSFDPTSPPQRVDGASAKRAVWTPFDATFDGGLQHSLAKLVALGHINIRRNVVDPGPVSLSGSAGGIDSSATDRGDSARSDATKLEAIVTPNATSTSRQLASGAYTTILHTGKRASASEHHRREPSMEAALDLVSALCSFQESFSQCSKSIDFTGYSNKDAIIAILALVPHNLYTLLGVDKETVELMVDSLACDESDFNASVRNFFLALESTATALN